MTKPINILIIGPFPDPISGVSIANINVKKILDKNKNFSVRIINTTYPKFDENLGKFSFKKFFFYLFINFKIYKIIKTDKVYITPGQTFFGILKYSPFIILSRFLKKELIIHVHGNFIRNQYKLLNGWKKNTYKYLISKFDKGIVLSNSLRPNLTPFLDEEKIFSLPNFAEDFLFKEQKIKNNTEAINIIYLSNLMQEKGIIVLLKVLQKLEKEGIAYAAKIAGNIDVKSQKTISNLLNNLENTTYLGIVKGEEKKNLLLWGNVFVLPTYYKMEGQPISIIEAMATNNVIITTNHAGISDLIMEGINGYFVEKKSINDLKEKLEYLINNKTTLNKIILNNKKLFLSNFTINKFEKKLINILLK
ncbi:glycosyltransferase family 4 protein [Polaribacter sp.]|uniref:glycosyltransferase family 4 protein n=1 Tax=Polaribacter sp. TaxID=1920175 RepID=UPI003F6B973D